MKDGQTINKITNQKIKMQQKGVICQKNFLVRNDLHKFWLSFMEQQVILNIELVLIFESAFVHNFILDK